MNNKTLNKNTSIFLLATLTLMFSFPTTFADSAELEVEIKIKDGIAKIEVDFEDEEYEFKLASSDIDEILEVTSLRTGISVELLEGAMKLEVKDESDDRHEDDERDEDNDDSDDFKTDTTEKKLRVSTLGDSSEVKIELEFITDTTDSELLIDEILENFVITQEEAEDVLKIQEENDELEEKFKVEIETKDGISEVEVELRYIIDSTNRDEIISSIIEQSHLDVDFLLDAIDTQVESDDASFDGVPDSGTSDDSELEELRTENDDLREENQLLREENNDLQKQLANLNNILMEQIRVIMDTLATLRS